MHKMKTEQKYRVSISISAPVSFPKSCGETWQNLVAVTNVVMRIGSESLTLDSQSNTIWRCSGIMKLVEGKLSFPDSRLQTFYSVRTKCDCKQTYCKVLDRINN